MASSSSSVTPDLRASSPRPSPPDVSSLPSSSQRSNLATTGHIKAAGGRFSDALSSLSGRNRTLSSASNSRNVSLTRGKETEDAADISTFGIDADPFASHYNESSSFAASPTSPPLPSSPATTTGVGAKKQRGSLLVAASDALGFGRGFSASFTKKINRRNSVDQGNIPIQQQSQAQQRRGLLWKGKSKATGHWALQPQSSSHVISDVIEISAAGGGRPSIRDSEDESEQKERERLREAAAESIGLSPLMREDSSSRLTGDGSAQLEDESFEEINSREGVESIEDDISDGLRSIEKSRSDANGTVKPNGLPNSLQLQLLQSRESKHYRSSSVSGIVTPPTPTSAGWGATMPIGQTLANGNGDLSKSSPSAISSACHHLPAFPCSYGSLQSFSRKSALLVKHFPPSPLLILGLSRQWRTRFLVLTCPLPKSSITSGHRPLSPSQKPITVCYLHLFKSSATDEKEVERLEITDKSAIYIAEEEIAGRRGVMKVGGIDIGGRKNELNVGENEQAMWLLSLTDEEESRRWVTILKHAVLEQRAEKVGLGSIGPLDTVPNPKQDLGTVFSMSSHDISEATRSDRSTDLHATSRSSSANAIHDITLRRALDNTNTSPTVRSWSGEGRPTSPSVRMMSLKGLFSGPGRARSPSRGRGVEKGASSEETTSFTSQGKTLLSMLHPSGNTDGPDANFTSPSSNSGPINSMASSLRVPGPILPMGSILSASERGFERPTIGHGRDLPDWYSLQNKHNNISGSSTSLNTVPSLLPPPRRRPWTASSIPTSKEEDFLGINNSSRKSFQDTSSLLPSRSSMDRERARSRSPIGSVGTETGDFGSPEQRPRRASLSSSLSSFTSPSVERDSNGKSSSSIQRRTRMGKLPKMLAPPTVPLPSVPINKLQLDLPAKHEIEMSSLNIPVDRPPSRSSSIRSGQNSDIMQSVTRPSNRRMSAPNVHSTSISNTNGSRPNRQLPSYTLPPKRISVPPPPRPAPTTALPPTPSQDSLLQDQSTPRKSSFRDSLSHRSLRFSLSPPPTKALPPRPDEPAFRGHRRSSSNGSISSKIHSPHANNGTNTVTNSPPAPPPTGPLPPTPNEAPAVNRHSSFRERLRMKSAPSSPPPNITRPPPSSFPGSPPLVTVSSVASLKDVRYPLPIGEPITAISDDDLDFLNMNSPTTATEEINFLNLSSPLAPKPTLPLPLRSTDRSSPPPEHVEGSPPTSEMTILPPPPRRSRALPPSKEKGNESVPPVDFSCAVEDDSLDSLISPSEDYFSLEAGVTL